MNEISPQLNPTTVTVQPPLPIPVAAPTSVQQQRALGVVQMQMMVAQQFPRDRAYAMQQILEECGRPKLAERAMYRYPRGDTIVSGPSIELLQVVAANWKHLDYGYEVLDRRDDFTWVNCWAWDLQNNVRIARTVEIRHRLELKDGFRPLKTERDIYEQVANQAQRRTRALLENVIPEQVVEQALLKCQETVAAKCDISADGLQKVAAFLSRWGVTVHDIERRFRIKWSAESDPGDLVFVTVQLRGAAASLRDGMATKEDLFPRNGAPEEKPEAPAPTPPPAPPTAPPAAPEPTQAPTPTATAEPTEPPPAAASEAFEYMLFDAQGDQVGDLLFTDPRRWFNAFNAQEKLTPPEEREALAEHNADALMDERVLDLAHRIATEEPSPEPSAPSAPPAAPEPPPIRTIEIPIARNDMPDWKQFLRDHVALIESLTAENFLAHWDAQQGTIVRGPQSIRMAVMARWGARARDLGIALPTNNAKSHANPAPAAVPTPAPEAAVPEAAKTEDTSVPFEPPAADSGNIDAIRARALVDGWVDIRHVGDLEAYLNSTLNKTLLMRFDRDQPQLAAWVRSQFGLKRAELGGGGV